MDHSCSIAILAGGAARRAGGVPKGTIRYRGRFLLDWILNPARSACSNTALICKDPTPYKQWNIRTIVENTTEYASIHGIYSAVTLMQTDRVLVLAVDLPNLTPEFLTYMLSIREKADVVIPHWSKHWEPLCAVYHKSTASPLKQLINSGEKRPIKLLESCSYESVTEGQIKMYGEPAHLFSNINTLDDH